MSTLFAEDANFVFIKIRELVSELIPGLISKNIPEIVDMIPKFE
jgi:hypothetical protein